MKLKIKEMGRSRSRSRTPKRHHKSKHRKKSRERDRSERRSISISSHSKYRDRSHERSSKSRYTTLKIRTKTIHGFLWAHLIRNEMFICFFFSFDFVEKDPFQFHLEAAATTH